MNQNKQTTGPKEYSSTFQQTVTRTLRTYPVTDKVVAVKLETATSYSGAPKYLGLPAERDAESRQFFAKSGDVKKFVAGKLDALPERRTGSDRHPLQLY